jgi:Flp pilus assembly protein CpaB
MLNKREFVQFRRKRGPEKIVLQAVMLAIITFVGMVGVVAFMHISREDVEAKNVVPAAAPVVPAGLVDLIVPVDNIAPGSALEPQMFRNDKRSQAVVSPGVVKSYEEVQGLFAKGLLVANQPVHRDLLTSLRPVNALTALIPQGYRAIAIPVDLTSSVEGWAKPGAMVDVIWTTDFTGEKLTTVIAQNVKVISSNQQLQGGQKPEEKDKKQEGNAIPNTVTLLINTRDSMRIRLAALNGKLALSLRGQESADAIPSQPSVITNVGDENQPLDGADSDIATVEIRDATRNGNVETLHWDTKRRAPVNKRR